MGCDNCSNNKKGKPNGCRSNGYCVSGGCNQMSVYNWLNNIEKTNSSQNEIVEISFKNGRKMYCVNEYKLTINAGEAVVVEGSPGKDVGIVTLTGELVVHQLARKKIKSNTREFKKIIRKATDKDIEKWKKARAREDKTMHISRETALKLGLEMKLCDVEFQGDETKATFYYTAEGRIDFRELIKIMANKINVRIEMKQIGARQESARLGGLGSCGRELCCSTWMTDFRSVTTNSARYQQLSLNPQKLAGQCGKLKCCLNYELDQYVEELKKFPSTKKTLLSKTGKATHIKTDVFKNVMWYLVKNKEDGTSILEFSVERVHEIIKMNADGIQPNDFLKFIHHTEEVEKEPEYSNVVGQDDLTRFDKVHKKKKGRNKKKKRKKFSNTKKQ